MAPSFFVSIWRGWKHSNTGVMADPPKSLPSSSIKVSYSYFHITYDIENSLDFKNSIILCVKLVDYNNMFR